MSENILKFNLPGTGAITLAAAIPVSSAYRLCHVTCHFGGPGVNTAPTTSEDFTVTFDAHAGPAYDLLLYSIDLSAGATYDVLWYPEEEHFLTGEDRIVVAFPGTDNVQFGLEVTFKAV